MTDRVRPHAQVRVVIGCPLGFAVQLLFASWWKARTPQLDLTSLPSQLIQHRHRSRGVFQPAYELQVDRLR